MTAPTKPQLDYVDALLAKLSLPRRMLDDHAVATFGRPFAGLDRAEVSAVIDQLIAWTQDDRALRVALGQTQMEGFGG